MGQPDFCVHSFAPGRVVSHNFHRNFELTLKQPFTMIEIPSSSQSVSSASHTSGSPPRLDPNVLALLDTHFREKAEEERLFQEIAAERAAAHIAGLALDDADAVEDKPMLSVAEFRLAFGEDWQLSQFW